MHYLREAPTADTLRDIVARLVEEPADLVRKDARFKKLGLDRADYTTPDEVVALLTEHIALMQRPLLDDGTEVIIARPPARAEAWLDERT